ncbi:MAG: M15 family metallopeptidase [Candidatus Saccharimonadaceae bacterium]
MSTSTLTPGDEKQDKKLNHVQEDADSRFDLTGAEKRGTINMDDFERNFGENADSGREDSNIDKLRNQESEGDGTAPWKTDVPGPAGSSTWQKIRTVAKKRGWIPTVLALFGIGGAGLAGVLGPMALPINLMENLSISNDSSSTSLERRFMKVFGFSTKESDPICAKTSKNIKCKMGRISNKALSQLAKKGVVAFDYDGKKTGYPTKNPTGYTIEVDGKKLNIASGDLTGYLVKNPKTAAKILGTKGAFNLRLKAWSGKYINKKLFSTFGVSKNGGVADGEKSTKKTVSEKYKESLQKLRDKIPGLEKLTGPSGVVETVEKKISGHLSKSKKAGAAYTLAVAGCISVKAPSYIAAGVAGVQLAQLLPIISDVILSPGSKIKASGVDITNSITPSDAENVGNLVTTKTARPSDGKMTSALDSVYLQSALGINKNKPAVSNDFTPGIGVLKNKAFVAANQAEKASESTCNALMSPAAMYTALAVDSATTIAASATIVGGLVKIVASFAITEIATKVTVKLAGNLAKDAIEFVGKNDKIAVAEGEQFGDVLGISAASFFSSGGMARNLPTLKTSQLSDFAMMQTENENFQKDMDIASLSPFDITSRYTFLGSIVYDMNMTSVANGTYSGGFFSSLLNLAHLPIANLSQDTSAATNFTDNSCGYAADFGLETANEADTPAINMAGMPCTGLTSDQANMSTDDALTLIQNEGWLDETQDIPDGATIDDLVGNYIIEGTPLSDFIETCGSPQTGDYLFNSAGCTTTSSTKSTTKVAANSVDASGCYTKEDGTKICSSDSGDFSDANTAGVKDPRSLQAISVFLLDFQAIQAINGEDDSSTISAPQADTGSVDGQPAGTVKKGKGWGLQNNTDYSSATCADGTTDAGTYTHPTAHFTIRKCAFDDAYVNALVSQNVVTMFNAARADGVTLSITNSFRSYEEQQALRAKNCSGNNCSPPTAEPGNSQHERGLAIDFGACNTHSTACYKWLDKNGATYGYYNLDSEAWHWSVSGN